MGTGLKFFDKKPQILTSTAKKEPSRRVVRPHHPCLFTTSIFFGGPAILFVPSWDNCQVGGYDLCPGAVLPVLSRAAIDGRQQTWSEEGKRVGRAANRDSVGVAAEAAGVYAPATSRHVGKDNPQQCTRALGGTHTHHNPLTTHNAKGAAAAVARLIFRFAFFFFRESSRRSRSPSRRHRHTNGVSETRGRGRSIYLC